VNCRTPETLQRLEHALGTVQAGKSSSKRTLCEERLIEIGQSGIAVVDMIAAR
jgi:hypothetical protein